MSAFNNNSRKKTSNNRIYLSLNIFIYLLVASFIFFEVKIAFKETNTGVKYKIVNKGKGMSISEYIEKVNKENVDRKDEKGKLISKKIENVQFLLIFERNITYKNKILEYNNENSRILFIYEYSHLVEGNYCGDYIECLNMLKNLGDTYLFKIKKKYLKNEESVKNLNISEEDEVCVELKLVDIMDSRNDYEIFASHINKVYTSYNNKKALEKELIMRYLNNIGRKYYVVGDYFITLDDPGRGEYIKEGDKVKYNVTKNKYGFKVYETTDEEIAKKNDIYDSKKEYKPLEIVYKKNNSYIDALCKFKKGSVGKIYYPSVTIDENRGVYFNEVFVDVVTVVPVPKKELAKKEVSKNINNTKIKFPEEIKKDNVSVTGSNKNNVVNVNNSRSENNKKNLNVEKNKKLKKEKKKVEEVDKIYLGKNKKNIKKDKNKEMSTGEIVEKAIEKRKKKTEENRKEIKKNNEKEKMFNKK